MLKKMTSLLLSISMILPLLTGCDILSSKEVKKSHLDDVNESIEYWEDIEDNVITWDNAPIETWEDVDDYTDWVYSEIVFSEMTDDYPIVACQVFDYQSNGQYFDGEAVYELVGADFDVNTFISQYAVGTGVIVICVVMTVVVSGAPTPVVCFIAGARDASISYATKGAAFGAAIAAIKEYLSGGDLEDMFYSALEGSAEGYMWGAIVGAATGGFNSAYCFTGDTCVTTESGLVSINAISVGDRVLTYNENCATYDYQTVTQVVTGSTNELVNVSVGGELISSTPNHPYLTENGWIAAEDLVAGNNIITVNGVSVVDEVELVELDDEITTYNICVDNTHTFVVGTSGLVVHNNCRTAPNQQYEGRRMHFDDPEWINDHPSRTAEEWRALAEKYPNGIFFKPANAQGISYPDFSEYATDLIDDSIVSFAEPGVGVNNCLNGNYYHDFTMADNSAGINESFRQNNGLTWNHNEDMQTMELIPRDIHDAVRHNGGAELLRRLFGL